MVISALSWNERTRRRLPDISLAVVVVMETLGFINDDTDEVEVDVVGEVEVDDEVEVSVVPLDSPSRLLTTHFRSTR